MLFWPSIATLTLLFLASIVIIWTCLIDLKLRLLPDELTIALLILGIIFRYVTWPYTGPWFDALLGALMGAGALATVRAVANRMYGFETMGLGDVKLLGVFGVWLGLEGTILALSIGAFAGVFHGIGLILWTKLTKTGIDSRSFQDFRGMSIPAGPGFCIGAVLIAIGQFAEIPLFNMVLKGL